MGNPKITVQKPWYLSFTLFKAPRIKISKSLFIDFLIGLFSDSSWSIWFIPIMKSLDNDFEILTFLRFLVQEPLVKDLCLRTTTFGFVMIDLKLA